MSRPNEAEHYYEAAERVLAAAERNGNRLDTKCSACRWQGEYAGGGDYECDNPLVVLASSNQTDAYARDRIRGCDEQRDTSSIYGEVVCGPGGLLFEPRARSLFERLFG